MDNILREILHKNLNDLAEAFNTPIDVKWNKGKNWVGEFEIDGGKYQVEITSHSDKEKHYLFKFTLDDKFDMINDVKKALTTIPTIKKAAIDFINEVKPNVLMFTALDKSRGRVKMYTSFCNDIKQSHGYEYMVKEMNGKKLFILLKEADPMELLNSIHDVLKSLQH